MRTLYIILIGFTIISISSCAFFDELLEISNTHSLSSTDRTTNIQSLTGDYNGAADVYIATTGQTYRSQSTWMRISYHGDDEVSVNANIANFGSFYVRGKANASFPLQQQRGNERYTFSATRIGNRIYARLIVERQRTTGGYELMRSAQANAVRN